MLGTDEIAGWMAYYEINPPGRMERQMAARVAYYSSRQFKKPPAWRKMIDEFDPQPETGPKAVHDTLAGLFAPPPDIAKRFKH